MTYVSVSICLNNHLQCLEVITWAVFGGHSWNVSQVTTWEVQFLQVITWAVLCLMFLERPLNNTRINKIITLTIQFFKSFLFSFVIQFSRDACELLSCFTTALFLFFKIVLKWNWIAWIYCYTYFLFINILYCVNFSKQIQTEPNLM